jgi:cell division protein FtsL
MLGQLENLVSLLENKKSVIVLTVFLFVITFFTSLVNICFKVNIDKLESSIEELSEDKANLRAQYLSEISLDNLSHRADELEMQQASNDNVHRVSTTREAKVFKALETRSIKKKSYKILVSGY